MCVYEWDNQTMKPLGTEYVDGWMEYTKINLYLFGYVLFLKFVVDCFPFLSHLRNYLEFISTQ